MAAASTAHGMWLAGLLFRRASRLRSRRHCSGSRSVAGAGRTITRTEEAISTAAATGRGCHRWVHTIASDRMV